MQIYPAIDLRGGKVVRLKEGDPNRQTVFSEDPLAIARQWIRGGATWIHVVNLDGTFDMANDNGLILENIAHMNVKVQFGGGLRSLYAISRAFEQGAARVVLGTIAIEQPGVVVEAVKRWGADAVCVALDARDGKITTHGWQQNSELTPIAFGKQMASDGVRHALYTDVSRDGLLGGVNVEATAALGRETGLQVIASGGVSSLDDVRRLKATGNVAGVVIGIALYEGKFTLEQAIEASR
ncbi:MAG: 1-(5-phosphoribosyl)-5-[(5-phosphoribosylamino)methylideneamino]imidazole-4-carboxamide isomerase [Anaerolineae bacterium]